jgi:hypothetical protein
VGNVGDQDCLVVVTSSGRFSMVMLAERHARLLGLQAMERAGHVGAAEEDGAGALAARIRIVALHEVPGAAVAAMAAGDGGQDHDPVTDIEVAHHGAELLDRAHGLVAQDRARLHVGHGAAHHVKVGAADRRRPDAHDGVGGLLDLGFGHVVEADVADAVEHDCFHGALQLRDRCLVKHSGGRASYRRVPPHGAVSVR